MNPWVVVLSFLVLAVAIYFAAIKIGKAINGGSKPKKKDDNCCGGNCHCN